MHEVQVGDARTHAMLCALLDRHSGAAHFTEEELARTGLGRRVISHIEPCSGLWELKVLGPAGQDCQAGADG